MSHMGIEEEFKEGDAPDFFSAHGRSSDPQFPAEDQFLRRSRRSSPSEENSWGDESLRGGGDPSSEGGAHQGSQMNEPHELLQDHRELQERENNYGEEAPGLAGPVVAPPVPDQMGGKKAKPKASKVLELGTDVANLGIKGLDVLKDDMVDPLSVVGDTANLLDGIGQTFENVQGVTDSLQEGLAPVTEFAQRANAAVGGFAKKVSTIPGTTIKTKDALKFGVGVMNIAQYHRNEGKDTADVNTFEKGALRDQLLLMRAAGREHAGAKRLVDKVGEAPEADADEDGIADHALMREEAEKLRRGAALRRFQATGRAVIANNALVKANKKKKIAPLPALTFEETAALNNKKYVPPKPLGFFDGTKDKPDFVPKKGMLVGKDTWDMTAAPDMANPGEILTGDAALAADPKRQDITRVNAVVNPKANRSALDDSGNVKADPNAVGDQDLEEDEIQARGGDGYRPETEEGRRKQSQMKYLRAIGAIGQVAQGNVDHERLIQQKRYKTAYLARAGELAAKTGTGLAVGATWGAAAGAGPIAAPLMAIGQLPKELAVHGIQELGRGVQSLSRAGERRMDPEGKAKEQDLKDTWNDFYGHSAPEQQDGEEPQPELADGEDRQVQNVQPAPRGTLSTIEEEPESEQESNEGSELKEASAPGGKISARMDQVLERGVGFGAQRNESELGARGRTWGRAAWDNTAGLGWKLTKALGSGFASVVKAPWHLAKLGAKLVGGAAKYSWKGLKWAGNKIGKGVKKLFGRGGAPAAEVPAQDPAAEEQRRAEESAKYTQRAQGPGAQSGAQQGHLRSLLGGGVDLANTNQRRADVGDDSVQQAYELLQARAAARRNGQMNIPGPQPQPDEDSQGGSDDSFDGGPDMGGAGPQRRRHPSDLFNVSDADDEQKDGAGQIANQADKSQHSALEGFNGKIGDNVAGENDAEDNNVSSEQQHFEVPEQDMVGAGQPRRKFPSDLFNVRDADDEQKQLSQGIASDGIASEQEFPNSGMVGAGPNSHPNVPAVEPDVPGEREPRARGSWGNRVDDWNKRADEAGVPLLMDPENPHSFVRDNPFPEPRRSLIEDVPLVDPGIHERAQAPVHRPAQGPMMRQLVAPGEWEMAPEELKEGFEPAGNGVQQEPGPPVVRNSPPRREVGELLDTSAPGLARHRQLMDPREMAILRNAADPVRAALQLPKIKAAVDQAQGAQAKDQATAAWRQVDSLQRRMKKRRLSAGSIPDAGKERARRDELLGGPRMIDLHEGINLPKAEVEDRRLESGGDEQFRLPNFNMPGDEFNIDDHADDRYDYVDRINENPAPYGNYLYGKLKGEGFRPKDNLTDEQKKKMAQFVFKSYRDDPQVRREIQQLDRRMVEQEYPADVMETKRVLFGDPKKNGKLDSLPTDDARKNMGPMTVDGREVFAQYDHRMPKNPKADDMKFGKYGAHRPLGIWRDRETNQIVDRSHVEGSANQHEERWMPPIREEQRVQPPAAGWDAMKKPWFWQTRAKQEYREKKESAKNVVADARKKMKDDQMLPPFVEKSAFGRKEWARLEEKERIDAELRKAALRARIHGANPTGRL